MNVDSTSVEARPRAAAGSAPTRAEWLGVIGLFLFALGLRLLHLAELRAHDPFFELPSVDPRMYHLWALEIHGGDWLGDRVFLNGPLYPYFLAGIYAVAGPSLLAAKAVQCVVGALSCVLVWALARRLFDRRVAFLAGTITAAYEMLVFYEGTLVVANVQVPLTLLSLLFVLRALERPGAGRFALAGACVGLSALARPNALLFAALIAGWTLVALRGEVPIGRRLALVGAFAAGTAALVLPVTARNYAVGGDPVLVTYAGGLNLYLGNNPDANGSFRVPRIFPRSIADDPWEQRAIFEAWAERASGRELLPSEVSAFWAAQARDFIREHPARWLHLELRKLALALNAFEPWNVRSITMSRRFSWVLRLPLVSFGVLAPFAFLGLALTLGRARRLVPLYALLSSVLVTLLAFFVLSRYRMAAVPVLAIFGAAGLVECFDALRARRLRRVAVAVALTALFAAGVHWPWRFAREDLSMAYYNLGNRYRELEQWELAIGSYLESLRRNPSYLSAQNNLAIAYEQSGRHDDEAIRLWETILAWARRQELPKYVDRAERHLQVLRERAGAEGATPQPAPTRQ
jgi:4-amino-4-deoxy-L-arabinose transferase-like glycosyltransferase